MVALTIFSGKVLTTRKMLQWLRLLQHLLIWDSDLQNRSGRILDFRKFRAGYIPAYVYLPRWLRFSLILLCRRNLWSVMTVLLQGAIATQSPLLKSICSITRPILSDHRYACLYSNRHNLQMFLNSSVSSSQHSHKAPEGVANSTPTNNW